MSYKRKKSFKDLSPGKKYHYDRAPKHIFLPFGHVGRNRLINSKTNQYTNEALNFKKENIFSCVLVFSPKLFPPPSTTVLEGVEFVSNRQERTAIYFPYMFMCISVIYLFSRISSPSRRKYNTKSIILEYKMNNLKKRPT